MGERGGGAVLRRWLPVLAWAALIFILSTDAFSSANTGSIVIDWLRKLLPGTSEATLDSLHFLIRKCAHLTEYFIFSWLLLRAVRGPESGWKLRWAFYALLIAAIYSAFDEFHQSFVPSRTASPWDSLLDTVGALAAQITAWAISLRRHPRDKTAG